MRDICGIGIAVLVLTSCAAVTPVQSVELRQWAEVSPVADCPYLNVFMDSTHEHPEKDKYFPGWRDAEPHRVKILNSAARSIPLAGWHIVAERNDAAFILRSEGYRMQGSRNHVVIKVSLAPTHKSIHHAFIASLNDSNFPLQDEGFAVSLDLTLFGAYTDVEIQNQLNRLLEFSQAQAFDTVAALCETRAQLTHEGTSLEELRVELIEEIHRVRRVRSREKQAKELKLEIESR